MEDKIRYFIELAEKALAEYDIKNCHLTYIRHSDNISFKVECTDSTSYLLRLHLPVTEAMGNHGADPEMVKSELTWLEALSRETDLVLQKPFRNRKGQLVIQIPVENRSVNCSMLNWVEGQSYHRDLESDSTAYQIGEILAKMHNQSSQWEISPCFKRPPRDIRYFKKVLQNIKPALDDGRIKLADYTEFETSIALLTEKMKSLPNTRKTWGIIHADAHKGNMLFHRGDIRLIDFSFCAMGNFMFDLGVCFSDMKPVLHQAFLEAYQSLRELPDDYPRLIEGFFVGSMVGTFSFWIANPRTQEILKTKFPQIARDYAAKFNRGESFWFSG